MLKVLHLINYPGRGGSEKYILTLAENLQDKCSFYLAHSLDGDLAQEMSRLNIPVFKLRMRGFWDLPAALRLKRFCRKHSIDVIHTHFLRENCLAVLAKILGCKVRLIHTRHMLLNNRAPVKFLNRILALFADGYIAVSKAVKKQMLQEGIPACKIALIYNGVAVAGSCDQAGGRQAELSGEITGLSNQPAKARTELLVPQDAFVVTCAARFSAEKGHYFLLEVIKRFNELRKDEKNRRDVRFLLAGDGALLNEIKAQAERDALDNVIFLGYYQDIATLLQASNLYVSPSKMEALGISVIEALASGLPVIATKVGGLPEILGNSNAGLLVEYGDTETFAQALLKLLEDEDFYQACQANALRTVQKHFRADTMAARTFTLYLNH